MKRLVLRLLSLLFYTLPSLNLPLLYDIVLFSRLSWPRRLVAEENLAHTHRDEVSI